MELDAENEFLLYLINTLFNECGDELINDISIVENRVIPTDFLDQKSCEVDLRAKNSEDMAFIVEVQQKDQYYYRRRSFHYIMSLLTHSVKKGKLPEVKPHVLIGILGFEFCKESEVNGRFNMTETTYTQCEYTDLLRIYTFDLVKLRTETKVS